MEEAVKFTIRKRPTPEESESGFNLPDFVVREIDDEYVRDFRKRSLDSFRILPFPNAKMEAWRRTDLQGLHPNNYSLDNKNVGDHIKVEAAEQQEGVVLTDIITAEKKYAHLLHKGIGKVVQPDEGMFAALAAASAQTGAFLYIPRDKHIELPLRSVISIDGKDKIVTSHTVVYLEENASATFMLEFTSPENNTNSVIHSGIVEIYLSKGANLNYVELQSLGNNIWNFTHERVKVEAEAEIDWVFGAMGSRLTKNFLDLDLVGQGAKGKVSGFYFTDGHQHLDLDTQQNHLAQNTTSDLLYKGTLLGNSRSVWQGMIYVAEGADKADGYQANRNLILSEKARADSIPGLEILANDVRCTHGATVGKLDKEQMFYLLSRGIPAKEAEKLIVEGFFDPIMQRIPFENVRQRFQDAIEEKMRNKYPI